MSAVPGGKKRRCSLPTGGAQQLSTDRNPQPQARRLYKHSLFPGQSLLETQKWHRPWCSMPLPAAMGAKDINSGIEKHVRFHQKQPGQQEWTPAHPPESSRYDWEPRQITNFQTALLCQCLLAEHAIHLEHQVPRDCRHQQKAHLDSKPLPFYLEGVQEDNSSESDSGKAWNTQQAL